MHLCLYLLTNLCNLDSAATNIFIHGNEEQSQLANEVRFLWGQNQALKEQLNLGSRGKINIFLQADIGTHTPAHSGQFCFKCPKSLLLPLSNTYTNIITHMAFNTDLKYFYFLQTSRGRTRSYVRLWPGGQPNWSRARRRLKH